MLRICCRVWIKNNTCEGGGHTYCVKNKKYPPFEHTNLFFNVKWNQCKHYHISINKVNILKERKLKKLQHTRKNCSAEKISYIEDVNTIGYMYTRRAMVLLQLLLLGTSYLRVQHIAYLLCQCAKMNLHEISKDPNNRSHIRVRYLGHLLHLCRWCSNELTTLPLVPISTSPIKSLWRRTLTNKTVMNASGDVHYKENKEISVRMYKYLFYLLISTAVIHGLKKYKQVHNTYPLPLSMI